MKNKIIPPKFNVNDLVSFQSGTDLIVGSIKYMQWLCFQEDWFYHIDGWMGEYRASELTKWDINDYL